MASMPIDRHRRFLTGGGDGTIRIWTIADGGDRGLQASSKHLSISPNHLLGCLAYRPSDHRVFVCHGRRIFDARLEDPSPPPAVEVSAEPQQVHIHPQHPNVVLLEVRT